MEVNILVARAMLTGTGCTMDVAVDGLDAVKKIEGNSYDIILMDIQMPLMNG
ncbi:MAG: response regulator [Flavobacteriales bacterium]|nr:response regulator [Flavobacteriales bacterium]